MHRANISVIIPTRNRVDKLLSTLRRIVECEPPPAEVIVHIDGGDTDTANVVNPVFPEVRLIQSAQQVGPGGGRNRLIRAASHPVVASFDDDSYPLDSDYFGVLEALFLKFPSAAVMAAETFDEGDTIRPVEDAALWVADFIGCGCAYKRESFMATTGYLALAIAYGMEEVDLALRLHDSGQGILKVGRLRVFHATTRMHHTASAITCASLANLALLAFLRYPVLCWWIGILQVCNRVLWLLRHGRLSGLIGGFLSVPMLIWQHRAMRSPVRSRTLSSYLKLRRQPIPVD